MERNNYTLVTKDSFPILFILLAMSGATLVIMGVVIVLVSGVKGEAILKLLEVGVPGAALIALGTRQRNVWVGKSTPEVVVTWGNRCPLPIHRYAAGSISRTEIKREQRFMVTPIPGGPVRTSRVPDRWRLLGFRATGRKVNLGSYATEAEAQGVANQLVGVK